MAAMLDFAHCAVFMLLNFEKTSLSLNIVDFIQFFALNSNMKSAFQSEIIFFCNFHFYFLVQDKSSIMIFFINFYIFLCSKISFEPKSILVNFCILGQVVENMRVLGVYLRHLCL